MRIASLLAVLFLLATSSTVLAAAKAIKFGKLVDGTGRVFTNAVVIVEDDRVQSVASGNASIPARSGGWPSPTWRAPQGPGPEPRPQTLSNSANNVQKNDTR